MSWTCPECGQTFRYANQGHTCSVISPDIHFARRPAALRELYDSLEDRILGLGDVRVRVLKSEIAFAHGATFAGVRVRKDRLELLFYLDHIDPDPPVVRYTDVSKTRVIHQVFLSRPDDITDRVMFLLQLAYDLIAARD